MGGQKGSGQGYHRMSARRSQQEGLSKRHNREESSGMQVGKCGHT